MKGNSVIVIGSLNYDIIFKQKRLPMMGETYTADSVSFAGGGKGANQAVQLARLGAECHLVGALGKDTFGAYLRTQLQQFGVENSRVTDTELKTGLASVACLEDGSVYATITEGANALVSTAAVDDALPLIDKSPIMVLQLEIPVETVEYAIEKGRQSDCFVILNAAPAKPISKAALSQVDCLIVNENEASYYCGQVIDSLESAEENCEVLFKLVRKLLVITLGGNGSLIYDGKTKVHVPAAEVDVVETTGAGDSFIGAFAYGLLCGKNHLKAAHFASAAAGLTVTRIGAQPAMPTLKEIEVFANL